ncbi:MAG: LytTR family transcriptional regulator [Lachnospiraceae bacterium]|nr:LytTR family transcriptional regulator [Lachnospiraceae bacterium]
MKVSVDVSAEYKEPFAVIHTCEINEEVQRMLDLFANPEAPVTAFRNEEDIVILKPRDIYMIRVENGTTVIYDGSGKYRSNRRLYELNRQLGNQLMQISKSTLVNPAYMDSIEAGFGGTYLLKLKNGAKDYVTRTYLPAFKKYLGL